MPLLLPNDPDQEGSGPGTLSADDLAPLLATALEQDRLARQKRREQQQQQQPPPPPLPPTAATLRGSAPPTAHHDEPPRFADLWSELMGRRCPALLARSLALAEHGTLRDVLLAASDAQARGPGPGQGLLCTILYVAQHEYAVIGPFHPGSGDPRAPAFVASDEATTCHLVGLREPGTGVVALAHVDSEEAAAAGLAAMERRLWEEVGARAQGQGASSSSSRVLDVWIVGGYDARQGSRSGGELLTARILAYFADQGDVAVTYRLQAALVSGTNTTALPPPYPSGLGAGGVPAPRCRSLGFCLRTGRAFTGAIPQEVKGPLRALRALRLWGWGARGMSEVVYRPPAAASAASSTGGSVVDDDGGTVLVAPFRYRGDAQARALLAVEDDAQLVAFTSTSPEAEAPSFALEMRETLRLLVGSRPEDFFGPAADAPAVAPVRRVDLRTLGGGGGS